MKDKDEDEKFSGEIETQKEFEKQLNDKTNMIFVLVFMNGCTWCEEMKMDWNNLNEFEMKNFKMICIEKSNIDSKFKDKHNIRGFPTLKISNKGKLLDYNGGRTFNDFEKSFSKHFVKCPTCSKKQKKKKKEKKKI